MLKQKEHLGVSKAPSDGSSDTLNLFVSGAAITQL
jgi:hypothetical protein